MRSSTARSLCARVGCARVANAAVVFDRQLLTVVLVPAQGLAVGAVLVCEMHAARVAVPVGWSLIDRRTERTPQVAMDGAPPDTTTTTDRPPRGSLLQRAFRAADSGSAIGQTRGLAWFEGLHQQVGSGPKHAANRMQQQGQADADGAAHDEDGSHRDTGPTEDQTDAAACKGKSAGIGRAKTPSRGSANASETAPWVMPGSNDSRRAVGCQPGLVCHHGTRRRDSAPRCCTHICTCSSAPAAAAKAQDKPPVA